MFPAQTITSPLITTNQDELIKPTPKDKPQYTEVYTSPDLTQPPGEINDMICDHQGYRAEVSDSSEQSDTDPKSKKESEREAQERYKLMYRRFAYCGPEKLRNLHKVSNVRKIKIPRHA